jgi:hypothetical protein
MTPVDAHTPDVAALQADMAAGTPGPWVAETLRTSCGVCHKIGPWPHKWRYGETMHACIYDDYPSPSEGTDTMLANARRIARLPDLEAAYIALTAELTELRLQVITADGQAGEHYDARIAAEAEVSRLRSALRSIADAPNDVSGGLQFSRIARAALTPKGA